MDMIREVMINLMNFESKNWKLMARLDWNINKSHKLSLRFNTVKSENDASISSTSSVITKANSNLMGLMHLHLEIPTYGFRNIVTSLSGELNSNFFFFSTKQIISDL